MSSSSEIDNSAGPSPQSAIRALRRFVRPRAPVERCELCSSELAPDHQHLFEPRARQLLCACQPCAVLFSGQAETKYRRVPRRVRYLPDFQLTDAQWDTLLIPIGMAFFSHSSAAGKTIALYPSPAGATESLLDLEAWDEIVRGNPALKQMEADTEALLVNRVREAREYFVAPVDECYKLVGLIRAYWHGLSGGATVWEEIAKFFEELKRKGGTVTGDR
ncbi:MAG TPA: DUF5947 family protein [Pyrinomonadaceae bacterium]|nr:DUF5947 family protein [Pyrinomonadaceae bacterium]